MSTYRIVRIDEDTDTETVIETGLTLAEANQRGWELDKTVTKPTEYYMARNEEAK